MKRPDEHIASQSQEEEAVMEAANLEDTVLSIVQVSASDDLQVRTRNKASSDAGYPTTAVTADNCD